MFNLLAVTFFVSLFHYKGEQLLSFKSPINLQYIDAKEWNFIVNEGGYFFCKLSMFLIYPVFIWLITESIFWTLLILIAQKGIFLIAFMPFTLFSSNKTINLVRNDFYGLYFLICLILIVFLLI